MQDMTKLDLATAIAPAMMLAAAIATAVPMPAIAAANAPGPIMVRTGDLDLSQPGGRQALDRRIARAARAVCGLDDIRTGTRVTSADAQLCYRQALQATRTQVAEITDNARQGG